MTSVKRTERKLSRTYDYRECITRRYGNYAALRCVFVFNLVYPQVDHLLKKLAILSCSQNAILTKSLVQNSDLIAILLSLCM